MHQTLRRTSLLALAAAALVLLPALPAAAQAGGAEEKPGDGDFSLMFTVFEPDALTNLGVFRMFGARMNIGLELELESAEADQRIEQESGLVIRSDVRDWRFLLGPSLRWYGTRVGPVSPYLRAKVAMGKGGFHLDTGDQRRREEERVDYHASLGIGAEWYPLDRIGIAGHTGIVWQRTETDVSDRNQQVEAELTTEAFRTFRSGLVINFYFR